MTPQDPHTLTTGHITGSLSKTHQQHLMKSALDDQDVFNELMEDEPLREAFADPVFRSRLAAKLRSKRAEEGLPFWEQVRRFVHQPWVFPVAGSVALSALLFFVIGNRGGEHQTASLAVSLSGTGIVPLAELLSVQTSESTQRETERNSEIRRNPPAKTGGGKLGLDQTGATPRYRAGQPMRIGYEPAQASSVMIVEERSDGSVVRLFPNRFQESAGVSSGEQVLVPPAGQGDLSVDGPPGPRVIRVLVFPPEVNPLDPSKSWAELQRSASVIEKRYEVIP